MTLTKERRTEKDVLRDIVSGTYKDEYVVYVRQSTDEAESQKNSIKYQKSEDTRFAAHNGLPIASLSLVGFCTNGIITEKHSGFKESDELSFSKDGMVQYRIDRPKFQRMVQYLNAGYFKGVICLCWDRVSRNKGDETIVRKLIKKGVDIRFAWATYDNSSSGELHMDIDGMFAVHHSRVTSEKVAATIRENRLLGKCTYRAPIGYLNEGSMDHKPHDPVRAPIITEMFRLYSTGDWSLSDLARHANQQGFTTVPVRPPRTRAEILADEDEEDLKEREKVSKPINENTVSRILTNPFYTGRVLGPDGKYVKSISHEALIDDDTFDQVQMLLTKRTISIHYTEKLDHPLRGVIRCTHCRRVYTPYVKKGILYFNARCVKGCENTIKNCNIDFVAEKIRGLITNLYFTDDELAKLEARTSTDISLLEEKRHKEFEQSERKKKRIRDDLAYLRTNRLSLLKSGAYTPEGIVEEQKKLERDYDALHEEEAISEQAMRELMQDVFTLSELTKNAVRIYDSANPHEKETIVRAIFSELSISQNTLEYKVKRASEPFTDRISALDDPIAWLSEVYMNRDSIKSSTKELRKIISKLNYQYPE